MYNGCALQGRSVWRVGLLLFLGSLCASSQTIVLTGPAFIPAGGSGRLSVSVSGTAATKLTAIQFFWNPAPVPGAPLEITFVPPSSGPNGALGLGFYCGTVTCIIVGFNGNAVENQPLADGVIGTFTLSVPASVSPGVYPLTVTSLLGASTTGQDVLIQPGPTFNLLVVSLCDINGDGDVNITDVQTVIVDVMAGTGAFTVKSVVDIINAALGGGCQM